MQEFRNLSPEDNIHKDIVFHVCLSKHMIEVLQDFVSHAFYRVLISQTKINQQNAQINSGLIYYWSITPTCFGPSVGAIIREFEILESYKAIVLIC